MDISLYFKLNWWEVITTWRQFENAPNINTRELECLKRDTWMSMVLKEASLCHTLYKSLTARCYCVLCWSWACSMVTDNAYSVKLVLHLSPLCEVFQELFDNILMLFKPSILCKRNSFHFGFNPLFKIWHRAQILFWQALFIFYGESFSYYLLLNSRIIPYSQCLVLLRVEKYPAK